MIRVLHVPVGADAKVVEIDPEDPEALPALLDGGFLEMVRVVGELVMFVDEDGGRKKLPVNFMVENLGPSTASKWA
jgi:hypothetical protein